LTDAGLLDRLDASGVRLLEPVPYVNFMNLVVGATAIITDSGGIQEETTYLGIPCLTLRDNTERPITVSHGTNRLVRAETLVAELEAALGRRGAPHAPPEHWDGRTAFRCVEDLRARNGSGRRRTR
jgi:UDP-N-acetylglucosamine 2-epimerase (non-hydrolysing)